MLYLIPAALVGAAGASFLLALASDSFAYALSRGVEAAFDFFEYRAALRAHRRAQTARHGDTARASKSAGFAPVYPHAA